MNRADLLHIIEEGIEDQFVFRTSFGDVFERPRRIEVGMDVAGLEPATCSIETADGVYIRPFDAIVSVEPAPVAADS